MITQQLKEVSHQSAEEGIPLHWSIKYYDNGKLITEYFETVEDCCTFLNNQFDEL
jgi:hypothetical protein